MSNKNIQVGVIGLPIILTIKEDGEVVNISSAAVKQIIIQRPDGSVLEETAIFATNGGDGKVKYVTVADDINDFGDYQAQAYAEIGAWKGRSSVVRFKAEDNLEE